MAKVISDILEGTHAEKDALGFKQLNRLILVSDLVEDASWGDRVQEAIVAAGLENSIGMPYPGSSAFLTTYNLLTRIMADAVETDIKLTCIYERPGPYNYPDLDYSEIEVGATTQQIETIKDKNAQDMWVQHTYAINDPDNPKKGEAEWLDKKTWPTNVMSPQPTWSVSRRELVNQAAVLARALAYVGRVNNNIWGPFAARSVLCTRIHGMSRDGGYSFIIKYEYQHSGWLPNWDQVAIYIGRDGKPPYPLDEYSYRTYQVQPDVDFSPLPVY